MTNDVSFFVWDFDPVMVSFGSLTIRWYGLMFALAFMFGFQLIQWVYKREGKPSEDLDSLFMYMVFGTIIGARLGHCFFYQADYFMAHPLEIFQVWKGGLASHGAAIGILTSLFIFSKTHKEQPYWWLVSRMTLIVALSAIFIRTGNFFNSEIIGTPSDLPWAIVFKRNLIYGAPVPRHPAQLYEALAYLFIFITMMVTYVKCGKDTKPSLLLGMFFGLVFTARFFIEYIKEEQEPFEAQLIKDLGLNMGQILSIPMVVFGVVMLCFAIRKKRV